MRQNLLYRRFRRRLRKFLRPIRDMAQRFLVVVETVSFRRYPPASTVAA
jgi:hypothetical protein